MNASDPKPKKPRALPLTAFGVAVVAMGLLLWARFLLVTGHPRTAIANPPVAAPEQAAGRPAPDGVTHAAIPTEQR